MPIATQRTLLSSTIALSVALSSYTHADEALTLDDLVVSASGFEQKITEAPASISVISSEELHQKPYSNLGEALEDVEGVDVRQGTGKTGGLNISIRGMPSDYTLVLIDGRRQNSAGDVTPNGFGETKNSFMPPLSAIERIEVIRGPMSTLYGSDAIGGVVNIITKKVASQWSSSITLDHTFQEDSDYGDTSNTSLYSSGPLVENLLGLTLRGSFYDRDESDLSYENDSTISRRGASPVEGENYNVGGRLTLTPSEDHDISLDFERGRQKYNNDDCQLGTLDGRSGNATNGCTSSGTTAGGYKDELRFERDQFALSHTGRFSFGTLDSSLTHNVTETIGRTVPGTIGVAYTGYPDIIGGADRELESTDLILDTKLVSPIGESHLLTVGGQYWDAELEDGIASETFEQTSWSLFTEDEWRLLDNLALTLGARYEDHEAFGGHVSPRAYLVWNTTENWTLKGGVSRGYKTPSLNNLHDGINGVTNQGQTITIGSPDLDPEISTNTEFGVYFDSLAGFDANATLFYNKFKDKIADGQALTNCYSSNYVSGSCVSYGSSFTQDSFSQLTNIDEAETQGVELAGSWTFAPAWTLALNYTFTESEQTSGEDKGAQLTNTPKHMANGRLSWQANNRLTLWLKGEYRSERERFTNRYANLSAANKLLLDQVGDLKEYELFHLGGAFKVNDNLTLNATIYNLLDKDFTKGTTYVNSSGSTVWTSEYIATGQSTTGTLEEGRRLWLSANLTF